MKHAPETLEDNGRAFGSEISLDWESSERASSSLDNLAPTRLPRCHDGELGSGKGRTDGMDSSGAPGWSGLRMDGLEFIDNHLSICFSFYNFHLNTRLLFFCARQLWRCSDFLGESQPYTRGGKFKTIYERASLF